MGIVEERIRQENEILKKVRREILKSAKKGDLHYYWEITNLPNSLVKSIIEILESEGKMAKSKGPNYKIIRW